MLAVYTDLHKEAVFPKKVFRAELQTSLENSGIGLQASLFLTEAEIIHALYYRFKNAHHCAVWWPSFSMLHRRVSQIGTWIVELQKSSKKRAPRLAGAIKQSIQKVQTRYLEPAFWSFYTILAQAQYVPAGFTLLGCLARISHLFAQVHPIPKTVGKCMDSAAESGTDRMADDVGEVIVRVTSGSSSKKTAKEQQSAKSSTSKGGKLAKKSTGTMDVESMDIDDIFSSKKKKKKTAKTLPIPDSVAVDNTDQDDFDQPAPKSLLPSSIKLKKTKVDNFFDSADAPRKLKKPAAHDESLEPPKKKKKKVDDGEGKKKKKKKNAIDDIFG